VTRERCPEALYGQHGEPNTVGKCPYCGAFLGRERTGRSTRSLTDAELDLTSWDSRAPKESQDPTAMDRSFEDNYYDKYGWED